MDHPVGEDFFSSASPSQSCFTERDVDIDRDVQMLVQWKRDDVTASCTCNTSTTSPMAGQCSIQI